jgi:hypothetical protein
MTFFIMMTNLHTVFNMENVDISGFQGARMFPKQRIICVFCKISTFEPSNVILASEHPATLLRETNKTFIAVLRVMLEINMCVHVIEVDLNSCRLKYFFPTLGEYCFIPCLANPPTSKSGDLE